MDTDVREENRLPGSVLRALEKTDHMPPDLRACVHEFGWAIVKVLIEQGVTSAGGIRAIVNSCWEGARQPHQRRTHARPSEERESPVVDKLDWLLVQAKAEITARTLIRILWHNGMVILPRDPGSIMVKASMATVSKHNMVLTKEKKHYLRLKEAVEAQAKRLWPHLFDKYQ